MNYELLVIVLAGFSVLVFTFLIFTIIKNSSIKKKYSPIIDIEKEIKKLDKTKNKIESDIEKIRNSYKEKRQIYDELVKRVGIYDDEIKLIELGFYKPNFDFDTSEQFKIAIMDCKDKQKRMIQDKRAVYCKAEWTIDGSKAKGRTMTNRNIRLTSRAFNNECDALIAKVKWNNIQKFEERIKKAQEIIDKMNASNQIFISNKYVNLKLEELRLTHEYREKKQQEKEEQAEIRRQMREEAKLQKDIENAEKEEEKYQKLLEKAKASAEKAAGDKLEKIKIQMAELEKELKIAKEKNLRAKSMAEQTRAGHVYIISNIGSFGDKVYKIGMTRRLDPMDRVRELGDASVPFKFDVHAMIYSKDAPTLENSLHKKFDKERLNLVNTRREFFNVTLEEIEEEVLKEFPNSEFIVTAEAREYRESEAIREQRERQKEKTEDNELPVSI